jgi:CRP-like cAMP-binding protein
MLNHSLMPSKPESIVELLHRHRPFDGVCQEAVRQCAQFARIRREQEGHTLWREGDAAEAFGMVDEGLVTITRENATGTSTILGFCGPGDVIGLVAALGQRPYPARVTVLSSTASIVMFRSLPIRALTQTDPAVSACFNKALIEHTRILHTKIDILSAGAVPHRLLSLFEHMAERFGQPLQGSRAMIPFVISRQQLAHFVGARIETVIRILSQWKKEGWFETVTDGFEIDIQQLRSLHTEG